MTGRRARRKAAQAKVSAGMSPATPGLPATPTPAQVASVRARKTLREQQQGKGSAALSSSDQLVLARIKHLEKVAAWASAAVPPLGAFLGARLAATCEAAGLAPSPAAQRSTCQRCESFLVPDVNCSVRAAKDHRRRQLKSSVGMAARPSTYLLYKCHYCQHGNKKPAPPPAKKVKKMSPSPGKPRENRGSGTEEGVRAGGEEQSLTPAAKETPAQQLVVGSSSSPFTPAPPSNSGKKRKRKGWTSLKEITSQNLEQSQAAKKQTLSALPSPLDPPRGPNLSALSNHMLRQLYSPG